MSTPPLLQVVSSELSPWKHTGVHHECCTYFPEFWSRQHTPPAVVRGGKDIVEFFFKLSNTDKEKLRDLNQPELRFWFVREASMSMNVGGHTQHTKTTFRTVGVNIFGAKGRWGSGGDTIQMTLTVSAMIDAVKKAPRGEIYEKVSMEMGLNKQLQEESDESNVEYDESYVEYLKEFKKKIEEGKEETRAMFEEYSQKLVESLQSNAS